MKRLAVLLFAVMCVFCAESGAQNYAAAVNYGTQLQPLGIVTGDFNRDGTPDVIDTNFGSASLSFYPGNGDGTLGIPAGIAVGAHPNFIAAGDFNGDGILDVAVSLANAQSFQVLLGNGNGTFQLPVTIAVPGLTSVDTLGQIVAADLNGDHRADVVIATSRGAAVFMNNGAGNFTESSNLDPGQQISSVAIADVNHDGRPDVIGVEAGSDSLGNPVGNVFLTAGNGDGSFAAMVPVRQFIGSPAGFAVGDINNDGLMDIVAANAGATLNDTGGGGGFGGGCGAIRICPPVDDPPPPQPITVPGSILVLLQQSDGTFSLGNNLGSDPSPSDLLLGDFNGDGNLDIADASASSPALILFLGQGNGTFAAGISLQLPFGASQIAAGPLTNTNAVDLAVTEPGGNLISVFVNQGANSLTLSSSPNPSGVSQSVALTATVHPKFSGTANGSGSVIFADGSQTLGTAPVNASGTSNLTTSFSSAGTHPILAVFSGSATLVGGSSARINQTVNRGAATVTLTSSANPASFGQTIVFDVSVSAGATGPVPSGTINLSNGSSIIISGSLDSAGRLSLSTSTLPIGTTNLTAQYSGDQNYTPSNSSTLTETITKGTVTVTASSSSNPTVFGQAASLVVHVAASGGGTAIPTGTLTLFDGTSSQASLPLDASGAASFSLATLNVGTHSLTVNYSGDTSFSPSSSNAVGQIINKSDTTMSLSTSPTSSVFGQAVQITATVQASGSGAGVPSGSVVFSDGATSLGTAVLNNGKATFSTSALGIGSHNISATYSGDGNFNSSSASGANGVTQAVAKSGTSTTLIGSPNPSVFGQTVILNATVAASGGGGGSPTGVVTFSDGTVSLGTPTITAGAASLSVTSLTPGSHSITVAYAGDGNFLPSTSAAFSQTVNKNSTTASIVASPNPSLFGQSVSFAVSVAASPGGAGIPTGNVLFTEGTASLGSVALDVNGKTSLNTGSLSVGSHTITASYVGDNNFQSSTATVKQTVNKTASSIALVSSPNPSTFGQAIALTATVTAAGGGTGTPTGSVTFTDGASTIGTAALDASGKAVLNSVGLSAGAHTITASYAGDNNFDPSSTAGAGSVSQVVNQSSTLTSLVSSVNPSVFGQAVVLSATVAASSGSGIPSGTVTFTDGSTSLGSGTLDSAGKASFSVSSLGAGAHSITAAYQGTTNFIGSASAPLVQTVSKTSVSIALTSAPNPSTFGQGVAFTVQVQSAGGAVGAAPSGTVSLSDGTINLGTVRLDNNGAAILTAASLTAGTHVITASYAGDANFTGGSSNPYSQVVNKAVTGTLLASSANPATVATAVTLSATVTAGAAIPSGTVAFFDGTQQIGSGQLDSSGKAVVPISTLSIGSHSFTAAYSGNTNFAASLSAALSETVVDSHSTVTLTSSANPQVASQPVTFVATVSPALSGPLNIGVVIFSDGTQHLAAIPVVNSIASFTTTTLTAGNHPITANYQAASAPGPFDGTSAVLTEVINSPNPGNKDFTMSIQQPVAYIRAGQSFTTKLILTPVNGLTGLETSICLGAPRGSVCTITPERATFNGKTTIIANVTISTTGSGYRYGGPTRGPSRPLKPLRSSAAVALSSLFAFGCVFLGGFKKQRVSLLTVALLAGVLTGCGGAGPSFKPPVNTPPGTYMLTVQSQHSSLVHSKQIELIVR
jgi:hypothetical protein